MSTAADFFQLEHDGDLLIVTPQADMRELAFQQIHASAKRVLELIDQSTIKNIVVDFHKTDSFGSTALGFFVRLLKRARIRNGLLVFCHISAHERDVLRTTNLEHSWPICATREDALAVITGAKA